MENDSSVTFYKMAGRSSIDSAIDEAARALGYKRVKEDQNMS